MSWKYLGLFIGRGAVAAACWMLAINAQAVTHPSAESADTHPIAPSAVAARMDAVDEFVTAEMKRQKAPGVALAIISQGRVIAAKGYGEANVELKVPVSTASIFQSGSVGKQFTSTVVMLMVEAGKLALNDPITRYFTDAPPSWRDITVRNLLTHTSGIPNYEEDSSSDGKTHRGIDYRRDYTDEELAKFAYAMPLQFTPGSRWSYSNTGYVLLGILVRKVSGQFYGDILRERVFAPLGMKTARVISESDIVPNRSAGYRLVDGELKNQEWVSPTLDSTADGSLYLSIADFIAWERGLRASTILKPESWAQVYTPVTLKSGKSFPYGFGWDVDEWQGKPWYHHGGAWQGFKSYISRYLSEDLTVEVLVNLAEARPERFVDGIVRSIDPKWIQINPTTPLPDHDPQVTRRLCAVLEKAAQGKLSAADLPFVHEDFQALAKEYQGILQPLGPIQKVDLVDRRTLGDDESYTYLVRYADRTLRAHIEVNKDGQLDGFNVYTEETNAGPVVIANAQLADGTGAALRKANVRIEGDRITKVGNFAPTQADRVIDAAGLVLAPGFIDIHNHSDGGLEKEPLAISQISQGITTIILGPDGSSPWPVGAWLDQRRRSPASVNLALTVGHATVRELVMGADYKRKARPAEVTEMSKLVEQAMGEGAIGLSSGVEYDVASYSDTDELVAVATAAAKHGGFYMTHVRDEADKSFAALDEEIAIGERAHIPVEHSHIKLGTVKVWGKAPDYIRVIESARRRGLDFLADCYPYDAWNSNIKVLVPDKQYENPQSVERALADVGGASHVTITEFAPNASYNGHTVEELAHNAGISPVDMFIRIVREGDAAGAEAEVIGQSMTEPDIKAFYQHPWVMVASDGGIGSQHPRGAGTFPRVLGQYVREKKWLTLPEAIRKMTSLPAKRLGWTDRGVIRPGAFADLVLFNPKTVTDRATFAHPDTLSEGIETVFVNGVSVWNHGKPTGARPGRVLPK